MNEFLVALGREITEKVPHTTYSVHTDSISIIYDGWCILTMSLESKLILYVPKRLNGYDSQIAFDITDPEFDPQLIVDIARQCKEIIYDSPNPFSPNPFPVSTR